MTHLDWQRRRILIWGKTRPELSKSYREVVCTGGVLEDTRRLVRLYPIPLRFLDDERVFRKYQWIEAEVARNPSDPRPESHKIRYETIETGETISTQQGSWKARAEWVMQPDNLFQSVEALKEQQKENGTSLGLVQPARVSEITSHRVPEQEKAEFMERYREAVRQMELPLDPDTGREIRPLRAADYRFKVHFRCDDPRCQKDHAFSVLDWEIDALLPAPHPAGAAAALGGSGSGGKAPGDLRPTEGHALLPGQYRQPPAQFHHRWPLVPEEAARGHSDPALLSAVEPSRWLPCLRSR